MVNEDGRPAAAVEVILDFVGEMKRQIKTITDKNGEWVRPGLPVSTGTWTITARRDKLEGSIQGVPVRLGETQRVPDIVLQTPESRAAGKKMVSMSAEAAAAVAKKRAEADKLLGEVNAAITAGNDDEAITKLKALVEAEPNCASCYTKLGELYTKKNDLAAAEAAFLKAIELDATQARPYSALASIYNQQRKFDEATKMGAKAQELMGTAGAADAATVFNQGVIFWNQSKVAEAKEQWAKAIAIDPNDGGRPLLAGHGKPEPGQDRRREGRLRGVPEAGADRPARRHREADSRDDQVAMPPPADIAANLDLVRSRLTAAAIRSGRSPDTITLIAVSKTFGADLVRDAAAHGQRHFGENRVQEGAPKAEALRDLGLEWHLIGHLQSNKAKKAVAAFSWIHSIDSRELLDKVDAAAVAIGATTARLDPGRPGARGHQVRRR